ncbi:MAG: hypothetical protein COT73_03200 [Bdellovibrio sp. CG10_big_fil_rev_8_21_14_0_10_47_8]|nr:MAG: hypothetical protein COT73_03200 [Bdellovibrio sp. CG10_big_fil_rev_8_21_14_0_10_47_8]
MKGTDKTARFTQILQELKEEYLIRFPEKIELIKKLTAEQKWTELGDEYHKLKGTGKTYGFPEVSIVCEQLELLAFESEQAHQKIFEEALPLLDRIYQAYLQKESYDLSKDSFVQNVLLSTGRGR